MVRRVVDLISEPAEACSPALMLRAAGGDTLRAVAVANVPYRSAIRAVHLQDVSMFAEALRGGGQASTIVRLEGMAAGRMAREAQTWNT